MKWETEGGKELLLVAIKKVCANEKLLVCKNGKFSFEIPQKIKDIEGKKL